eukprot:5248935-Prymnesium_polylepis.1
MPVASGGIESLWAVTETAAVQRVGTGAAACEVEQVASRVAVEVRMVGMAAVATVTEDRVGARWVRGAGMPAVG